MKTGPIETALAVRESALERYAYLLGPIAPVLTLSGNAVVYTENATPQIIDATATLIDVDSTNFDTGTLTVRFSSNGTAADRLSIRNAGTGPTQINLDGREVYYGNTKIGNFIGETGA